MGNKIKPRKSEYVFDLFNYLLLITLAVSTLYPFLYILTISLSNGPEATKQGLHLIPSKPTLEAYKTIFEDNVIVKAFFNSIFRTVLGTVINDIMTLTVAYALSKKYLPGRNFFTIFIVFTMFFSGGLIPTFLLIKNLHMMNTIWALVVPGAIATGNMLIARNYFMSLPAELEESARIDGANDARVLVSIILPVSMSIIATISLWYALGHWNAWFDAMIYVTNEKFMVLQLILRRMIVEGSQSLLKLNPNSLNIEKQGFTPTPEILKAATIMVSSIPILVLYPFVQKYFVKGIMIGSLKG